MKHTLIGMSALAGVILHASAAVTFESIPLTPESHWDGSDLSGAPVPGGFGETAYIQTKDVEGVGFRNTYTDWGGYGSWSGFAISNHTDTTTPGWGNQYSAYTGGGAGASANYAVGFFATYEASTHISLGALTDLAGKGMSVTNTTYAALEMLNGGYGKKFGGATGDDADWFLLTITGYAAGAPTGTTLDFYLADYRFADNSQDYIVDAWTFLDLSPLGGVDELRFSLSSSDTGGLGMNTPAYFAMDNFLAVPEPSSLLVSSVGLLLVFRRRRNA